MTLTKSGILQARVYPHIKHASEQILSRIGLSMSDAMDLFLRRVIVDERLPFDVVALKEPTLERITEAWTAAIKAQGTPRKPAAGNRQGSGGGARKTNPKVSGEVSAGTSWSTGKDRPRVEKN